MNYVDLYGIIREDVDRIYVSPYSCTEGWKVPVGGFENLSGIDYGSTREKQNMWNNGVCNEGSNQQEKRETVDKE
jgi:hypothetical protein